MTGRFCSLAAFGWLLLACAPAAARTAAATTAATPPAPTRPGPTEPAPPPDDASPKASGAFVCTVEVEIRDPTRARGNASSDDDPEAARKLAWQRACDDLRTNAGLDCEDETRVRVVKRSSSTRMETGPDGRPKAHYEQTYELTSFREATGTADSDDSRLAACRRATERACESALDAPCPDGRVTVLRTDQTAGDRPGAPRPTI